MVHFSWKAGLSSFLFVVSTYHAFQHSELVFYQWANAFLVVASFMNNATDFHPVCMRIDYAAIYTLTLSYMNNRYINVPTTMLMFVEYKTFGTVKKTVNLGFMLAGVVSVTNTYKYKQPWQGHLLLGSICCGSAAYLIRFDPRITKDNRFLQTLLTVLWHLSCTTIASVASLTAVHCLFKTNITEETMD